MSRVLLCWIVVKKELDLCGGDFHNLLLNIFTNKKYVFLYTGTLVEVLSYTIKRPLHVLCKPGTYPTP